MKQKCIRCEVNVHFSEVEWQVSAGVSVILEGPSVFVRACVLGQLQYSHLHTPAFPVTLNQTLTFDRVLTNCRTPSLFKEVIRGEHVKFELIQVSSDFKGGKILARFDTPAHKFLFPDCPNGENLQQVVMDKARKYQHPPQLTYTCSTSLSEVTVQSPMDSILTHGPTTQHKDAADEGTDQLTMSALGNGTSPRRTPQHIDNNTSSLDGDHTRPKLHSLLDSYLEPSKRETKEHKTPDRVKFKPPVPKSSKSVSSKQTQSLPPTTVTHSPFLSSQLFRSTTAKLGPHQWVECPRRSPKRQRSLSAPSLPVRRAKFANSENIRPLSADVDGLLAVSDLEDPQEEVMDTRPPFVVRHIDQHLMGRWDFCGCSRSKSIESGQVNMLSGISKMSKSDTNRSELKQSALRKDKNSSKSDTSRSGLKQSALRKDRAALDDLELEGKMPPYLNESLQMSHEDYTNADHTGTLSSSIISPSKERPRSVQFTTPIGTPTLSEPTSHCNNEKQELLSKYLVAGSSHMRRGLCRPGNMRRGVDSLGRVIEERIERLRAECSDWQHRADSLGEDSLSEDLDRLRASLQAERDDHLSQTGRLAPPDNVTVKIGPRDYWSRRMSEFTGKKHRLLFDETLEKIYNKLYTDASQSV